MGVRKMEIRFVKKWIDKEDDSYYYVSVEPRVSREVFTACYRAGAVKKIEDDDLGLTLWDWDEQKATPILQKFGYKVVNTKEQEAKQRKIEIEKKLREKLEDPNTYVPDKSFETEYAGYSYSSTIVAKKVLSEEEKEITLNEEGITATGKAKIMLVEGYHKRVFDGQEFSKPGKFLLVEIGEKKFFAEVE